MCRVRGGAVLLSGCSRATVDLLQRMGLSRVFRITSASALVGRPGAFEQIEVA